MNIEEYYKHYLSLHQTRGCKIFHIIGQLVTIGFVLVCLYLKIWVLLLMSPFVVYPFAWAGHLLFEKNIPAAFSNPVKAKICDYMMIKDIITGKIAL